MARPSNRAVEKGLAVAHMVVAGVSIAVFTIAIALTLLFLGIAIRSGVIQ
jgi:hypothetical protein